MGTRTHKIPVQPGGRGLRGREVGKWFGTVLLWDMEVPQAERVPTLKAGDFEGL